MRERARGWRQARAVMLALAGGLCLAGCGTSMPSLSPPPLSPPTASLPGHSTANQTAGTPDLDAAETLIFTATNAFRKSAGINSTTRAPLLDKTATEFARFMARTGRYGHDADGRQPSERAAAAGYGFCMVAENIGYNQRQAGMTTDELARFFVEGWKNSPTHRRNMLRANADHMAVALAKSPDGQKWYGVQLFGQPESRRAKFQIANATDGSLGYVLNGKRQTLGAKFTHTINRCAPLELALDGLTGASALTPSNDTRYEIARNGTRLVLRQTRIEK